MEQVKNQRGRLGFKAQRQADAALIDDLVRCLDKDQSPRRDSAELEHLRARVKATLETHDRMQQNIENKEVTILLSDLRGFTAMSEGLRGDLVIDMLNRYFKHMNEVIAKYDGIIDKYMGDAIMVLFGVKETREDDLPRAIACAVEMQLRMDKVNRENADRALPCLYMGIGINAGIVATGALGSDLHFEYSVIGDEVNLTSRIEAQTLRGQILIDDKAYQRVADSVDTNDPSDICVKGKTGPLRVYEIVATHWPEHMAVPRREYRACPRIEIEAPFQFQLVVDKQVLPTIYHGQAKDIGYYGMFAMLPKLDAAIEEIKVSMSLSILSGETRDIYGRVQTVRETADGLGCSIEFTSTSPECQAALKEFVDRVITGMAD